MSHHASLPSLATAALLLAAAAPVLTQPAAGPVDLAIAGGRVIDPESGLDGIRHVGIRGDRIVAVSAAPLEARETLDATGLVVSPGFVDLHRHAHGDRSYRFAARDGVTSAFEIEIGAQDVDAWYRGLGPARLINFGVAASHIGARMQVLGDKGFLLPTGPGRGPATPDQVTRIVALVEAGLADGGVAVGTGPAYTPGASADELAAVFRVAAAHGAFVMAHLGGSAGGFDALMALAATTGTALHIAHVNSTAGDAVKTWLDRIRAARADGQDVTTEVYPYTAGATLIQSALYDDWETWPDARFARFQWAATGERLTRESFGRYRAQGGSVIAHGNSEESLRLGIADPLPMFASDAGRDLEDRPTHPRATGTFARILGHYVRDERVLSLPDALRRMTLDPARRLEGRVPEMRDRGRVRVGAYADITIFDPGTVIDRSSYTDAAVASEGIVHVLVNGVPVVRAGVLDETAVLFGRPVQIGARMPGRPIRAPRERRP
ncbi:MAG: amidohydrolase family protein [Vicinamibacterales bacterium]